MEIFRLTRAAWVGTLGSIMGMTATGPTELLRLNDILRLMGISRSELYRMMKSGEFPRPLKIGERAVAWRRSVYEDWISSRPAA